MRKSAETCDMPRLQKAVEIVRLRFYDGRQFYDVGERLNAKNKSCSKYKTVLHLKDTISPFLGHLNTRSLPSTRNRPPFGRFGAAFASAMTESTLF